jgi:DNA-binding NarL/FixJ family response regulator
MKLRILLADDHEIVRRGLCSLLQKHEGWEVCGEASDGREAIEMAKRLKARCRHCRYRHAQPQRPGNYSPAHAV